MLKRELPGTKLLIVDDLAPEDLAMLQALYSRSAESAEVHLEKVQKAGSGKFMSRFYVGYNHKSIADCGTTTMFIEGVSTLAAKAVQDWPLYSGQETSTRYIDMSKQRIEDPLGTPRSKEVHARWMEFYTSSQSRVEEIIRKRFPATDADKKDDKTRENYERAVKARVFDSLRGFLPAGITTQLSWHTNLRQAGDHLSLLAKHPAAEIRTVGQALQKMFAEQYSSSTDFDAAAVSAVTGGAEARATWEAKMVEKYTFTSSLGFPSTNEGFHSTLSQGNLASYHELLQSRPRGSVIPHFLSDIGQLSFAFLLDFGSFRDIQRHRNGVCRMPLLTLDYGFEPWYLEQLDEELTGKAKDLIAFLSGAITHMTDDPIARQYYIPLGFRVPCQVTYALPAAVYVMELRSGKTIHPTLRRVIHWMIGRFREKYPEIPLHVDMDPDDWTVRRGQQTIQAR
jgi:thymidylate synthase ThyX